MYVSTSQVFQKVKHCDPTKYFGKGCYLLINIQGLAMTNKLNTEFQ